MILNQNGHNGRSIKIILEHLTAKQNTNHRKTIKLQVKQNIRYKQHNKIKNPNKYVKSTEIIQYCNISHKNTNSILE